jgi:hypothetical protein
MPHLGAHTQGELITRLEDDRDICKLGILLPRTSGRVRQGVAGGDLGPRAWLS